MSRLPQSASRPFANSSIEHRQHSLAEGLHSSPSGPGAQFTALNLEFVAKPEAARTVHVALPDAIHSAFAGVTGFAGGFVFIANYEARLVTVVTLWTGCNRVQLSEENLRWVRALVAPYLDRCLRVQTLSVVPSNPDGLVAALDAPITSSECQQQTEPQEDAVYAA